MSCLHFCFVKVSDVITKNKDELVKNRYKFPLGNLMSMVAFFILKSLKIKLNLIEKKVIYVLNLNGQMAN